MTKQPTNENLGSAYALRQRNDGDWEVLRITRVGQRYCKDSEGYEYPQYVYDVDLLATFETLREARAYLAGISSRYDAALNYIEHPTSTASMGSPGKYPLDERGGPLFSIVKGD